MGIVSKEIKAAIIGVIGAVISAIIGAYFGAYFERNVDKEDAVFNVCETDEYKSLENDYNTLDYEKANLQNTNETLQAKINNLQNQIAEIPILNQEIASLKEEIENLNQQIEESEGNGEPQEPQEPPEPPESTISKVSIFDLDTFRGESYWYDNSDYSSSYFVDTYDNSHEMAYLTFHKAIDKDDKDNPVYLLNKEYSFCEGQIAWSKKFKNSEDSIWIEFYSIIDSEETLLYRTEPSITADNRPLDFSFSVVGVEKMKIVTNGTNPYSSVAIIYQYLNLVK